ncbi:hypothetical protein Q5H93_20980 [Hymenobacter sp. ASUV-10]|uniref:Uncharacterized protein n=1 Tax=Hymenobacter aranciens TaxID=3063996 RepID=A0ABT9BG39_9BACT|nr:hypothetical protein [Hymenobacter sp. ASUV-10]MDO7877233.1 hypothetical protein [Hymenobacter sp. ASUV-10]
MISPFLENRNFVKDALQTFRVFEAIEDSEYQIREKRANQPGNLKLINIEGIPFSKKSSITNIWSFDFEIEDKLFYTPKCSKVEKGLIVFSKKEAYVILIEMKSKLYGSGDDGLLKIEDKLRDSLSKLSLFATPFIFNERHSYIKRVNFFFLIAFNTEHVTQQANADINIKKYQLYPAFLASKEGKSKSLILRDYFGQTFNIEIMFIENKGREKEELEINLDDIINSPEFSEAKTHEFTCP